MSAQCLTSRTEDKILYQLKERKSNTTMTDKNSEQPILNVKRCRIYRLPKKVNNTASLAGTSSSTAVGSNSFLPIYAQKKVMVKTEKEDSAEEQGDNPTLITDLSLLVNEQQAVKKAVKKKNEGTSSTTAINDGSSYNIDLTKNALYCRRYREKKRMKRRQILGEITDSSVLAQKQQEVTEKREKESTSGTTAINDGSSNIDLTKNALYCRRYREKKKMNREQNLGVKTDSSLPAQKKQDVTVIEEKEGTSNTTATNNGSFFNIDLSKNAVYCRRYSKKKRMNKRENRAVITDSSFPAQKRQEVTVIEEKEGSTEKDEQQSLIQKCYIFKPCTNVNKLDLLVRTSGATPIDADSSIDTSRSKDYFLFSFVVMNEQEGETVTGEKCTINEEQMPLNEEEVTIKEEKVIVIEGGVTIKEEEISVMEERVMIKEENLMEIKEEEEMLNEEILAETDEENVIIKEEEMSEIKEEMSDLEEEMSEIEEEDIMMGEEKQVKARTKLSSKVTIKRKKWDKCAMEEAIRCVREGKMGLKKAGKFFAVPKTTLRRFAKSEVSPDLVTQTKLGRKPVLNPDLEKYLVEYLVLMESIFHGLTSSDIRRLAYQLATKKRIKHPFKNEKAGRGWMDYFLTRNKDTLSLRKPTGTPNAVPKGFNRESVKTFFDILEAEYIKHKYSPDRIFNVNETGLSVVQTKTPHVIGSKGKRQIGALTAGERDTLVTLVCSMSAAGTYIPPMLIFPRKRISTILMKGAPPGALGRAHPSGWIQSHLFLEWFQHFIKIISPTKEDPVLLILDGHYSHAKNLEIIELARENHVTILSLPPRAAHQMQPLDKTFIGPLKVNYAEEIRQFMLHSDRLLAARDIAQLLGTAFLKCQTAEIAINGFKATGIFPLNRNVFNDADFSPDLQTSMSLSHPHSLQNYNRYTETNRTTVQETQVYVNSDKNNAGEHYN